MRKRTFCLIGCALVALAGCGDSTETAGDANSAESQEPIKVSLALNWFPEAEHGGFYAADVHGHFADAGLDVTIVPGGPGAPVLQEVATGKVMFGVSTAERVLLGRAQGADVVALMAALQDSPRCIMVHEKSGIRKLKDLRGLTLAVGTGSPTAEFLKTQLPLEDVEIVPYSGNVAEFLINENFAQQAYVFSEPFVAEKNGGDPHCLMISELGFNPYTSLLITTSEAIAEHPELVQKMVTASVRGWQAYLETPVETNRDINRQNPEMDLDILAFGAESMRELCVNESTSKSKLGRMTLDRWRTLTEQLEATGLIDQGVVEPQAAFTLQFLDRHEDDASPVDTAASAK